jgi:uncharacterized Zn finger protein (UPF0148 family)
MFKQTIRALEELEKTTRCEMPLPSVADSDGYIDKECPNQECLFAFKVHRDDWKSIVRNEEVFCPFCGHRAPADNWFTTQEIEWAKKAAIQQIKDKFQGALQRDAQEWNRRFISMKLNYKRGPREILLPRSASDPMTLKIACPQCKCRYCVIGSAYFCPSCGHNAADQVFDQSLDKTLQALDAGAAIRAALQDRDAAENTIRLLVENGLQQAVTAFQRFAEALWDAVSGAAKARRNAFQNLQEGGTLWASVGKPYSSFLSATEMQSLVKYFQQRHLLAHREGLVDLDYISRSGDTTYRAGQRLVIREEAVRDFVSLIRKLGHGLRA